MSIMFIEIFVFPALAVESILTALHPLFLLGIGMDHKNDLIVGHCNSYLCTHMGEDGFHALMD